MKSNVYTLTAELSRLTHKGPNGCQLPAKTRYQQLRQIHKLKIITRLINEYPFFTAENRTEYDFIEQSLKFLALYKGCSLGLYTATLRATIYL
jgi:hypothetical protein